MYESKLKELGLTQGEAKVYEALLRLGSSTVGPVVKKANVAYSNIYEILNRLQEKGLVSYIIKERIKYFQAESPDSIHEFLTKEENELKKKRKTFLQLQEKLENLQSLTSKKEEAEVFIGEKGLMTAYEKLTKGSNAKDGGFFFYVYNQKDYKKSEFFYTKLWHMLKKKGNTWKGLSHENFKQTRLVKKYPSFVKQKYVNFPVPGNIDFMNNKVLITTWGEKPVGILIHSKEIFSSFKEYFESVWKQAKK